MKENKAGKYPKMEQVLEKLRLLAKKEAARDPAPPLIKGGQGRGEDFHTLGEKPVETVADDGEVAAEKHAAIVRAEQLIRPALKMFGVDYDALIKMDGKSAYAQAVAARPEVVRNVLSSDNPVLAALEVATKFAPHAEFAQKYGTDPKQVKDNIAKEVLAADAGAAGTSAEKAVGPVFSRAYVGGRAANAVKTTEFSSIFKK